MITRRSGPFSVQIKIVTYRCQNDQIFEIIQTEAERRRREAGVKQSMEIRLRSCMYVHMYVWYLELSREPRHVAQQMRY